MNYRQLVNEAAAKCGDFTACEVLFCQATGINREEFWSGNYKKSISKKAIRTFWGWVKRLCAGEPLAYIIGKKEFFGRSFLVSPAVLIPRPETELLVEGALELKNRVKRILEIGAGSGCIAVTLAIELSAEVVAVEKSLRAVKILQKNIALYGLEKSVRVVIGDLFPAEKEQFDLIISNPPYVSIQEWENLPQTIRLYEPRQALLAKNNGYQFFWRILKNCRSYLKDNGWLLLEAGAGQKEKIESIARRFNWKVDRWYLDLGGIERVCQLR